MERANLRFVSGDAVFNGGSAAANGQAAENVRRYGAYAGGRFNASMGM